MKFDKDGVFAIVCSRGGPFLGAGLKLIDGCGVLFAKNVISRSDIREGQKYFREVHIHAHYCWNNSSWSKVFSIDGSEKEKYDQTISNFLKYENKNDCDMLEKATSINLCGDCCSKFTKDSERDSPILNNI